MRAPPARPLSSGFGVPIGIKDGDDELGSRSIERGNSTDGVSAGGREMIERRNREFAHRAKSIYLAMPTSTTLGQNLTSTGNQTGRLAREFVAVATRPNSESLEQRQRV